MASTGESFSCANSSEGSTLVDLADQDLGLDGHLDAGDLGDGVRRLTHDLGVDAAVDDDGLAHLVELGRLQEVAATSCELGLRGLRRSCRARW
jgi:hypothetical protein